MIDFVSLLDQQARTRPERVALRYNGQEWNYAELRLQGLKAAAVLASEGVERGDRVALVCFNTPGFVFALLGAWRLGAAIVPVNHKLKAPEVEYILSHSRARLCVVDGQLAALATQTHSRTRWLSTDSPAEGLVSFDALLQQARSDTHAGDPPSSDELAEILYTSGTTGRPKGCLHSHANVFHAALCAATSTSMTYLDRTLIAMPIWHSSPLNNWFLGTLLMGGAAVFMREYAPKPFLDALQDERITFTFGAPIAFLAPLTAVPDVTGYDFSRMRLWAYGGGPIGEEMARKLTEVYRSDRFIQVYGMTESGPLGTVMYPEETLVKAGSIGRCAVPGVVLEVRRPDGSLCAPGETGEIHLRSAAMMQGYLDDPQGTAAAFDARGWYRSGDLARLDDDGYLYIVDRLKDMIVTGGENVYSKEVEDVLSTHPDVQDVAVIGRPHPEWGETVAAILVMRPGRSLDEKAMRAYLEPQLAKYKIPRVYEQRKELPRTATGKLIKHLLKG